MFAHPPDDGWGRRKRFGVGRNRSRSRKRWPRGSGIDLGSGQVGCGRGIGQSRGLRRCPVDRCPCDSYGPAFRNPSWRRRGICNFRRRTPRWSHRGGGRSRGRRFTRRGRRGAFDLRRIATRCRDGWRIGRGGRPEFGGGRRACRSGRSCDLDGSGGAGIRSGTRARGRRRGRFTAWCWHVRRRFRRRTPRLALRDSRRRWSFARSRRRCPRGLGRDGGRSRALGQRGSLGTRGRRIHARRLDPRCRGSGCRGCGW